MQIHESAEMYLETILVLSRRRGSVRSVEIAEEMGFSKPSVSVAMRQLRENGYIAMEPDGLIKLTPEGSQLAEQVYNRHRQLTEYFVSIGVSLETAERDACRIEHIISDETFARICAQIPDQPL